MVGTRMFGAPALAARAALRAGCGLARLVVPEPLLDAAIGLIPSATGRALPVENNGDLIAHLAACVFDEAARNAGALVVGPGLVAARVPGRSCCARRGRTRHRWCSTRTA